MSVFVDSNVLLRTADPGDPKYADALHSITSLLAAGQSLVITPQIAAEFWNVATRPSDKNDLGMSIEESGKRSPSSKASCPVLEESIDVCAEWKRLVVAHGVSGVQVHDVRIVAAMTSTASQNS